MALLDQSMGMGKAQRHNFTPTHAAPRKYRRLVEEYNKVTGSPLDNRLKSWAFWNMMDKDTLKRPRCSRSLRIPGAHIRTSVICWKSFTPKTRALNRITGW